MLMKICRVAVELGERCLLDPFQLDMVNLQLEEQRVTPWIAQYSGNFVIWMCGWLDGATPEEIASAREQNSFV
ncbi:MAG TPA: hypothetical protein VFQ61_06565 [Polyangiaceae bacterium]|nr:hypothetical protein [Polyangiaceae bacterium]